MIIQSSQVQSSASHEKSESIDYSISSTQKIYSTPQDSGSLNAFQLMLNEFNTNTESVDNENSILIITKNGFEFRTADDNQSDTESEMETSMKLFNRLLEAISKRLGEFVDLPNQSAQNTSSSASDESQLATQSTDALSLETGRRTFIELSLQSSTHIEEHESLDYNSTGKITTVDGREISFDLSMSKERDYSYTSTSDFTQKIEFKDPLIINYPGSSSELSNEKYAFDIDADGNEEMISYFINAPMLALDKNDDGIINDGSELFGAISGNGFTDLAAYDEDGNFFIDEGDSIFNDLKLWTKTENTDTLESLSSMDIGAIYLGATDTPFDIKGENNQFNGQLKASSFYLTEAGEVGSVQQVDMVV